MTAPTQPAPGAQDDAAWASLVSLARVECSAMLDGGIAGKINAIKHARNMLGLDLRQAKDWVEAGFPTLVQRTDLRIPSVAGQLTAALAVLTTAQQQTCAQASRVAELEAALEAAIRVADEARDEWDRAPSGMKAGKLLMALSDRRLRYRADIDAIHAARAALTPEPSNG